jgi:hypothetical protein
MKRCITAVVGLVALLMMVMPSVASAEVVWVPERVRPVAVQEAVVPAIVPAPLESVAYYRPWACANPYYRHHHLWRCR